LYIVIEWLRASQNFIMFVSLIIFIVSVFICLEWLTVNVCLLCGNCPLHVCLIRKSPSSSKCLLVIMPKETCIFLHK